jgi:hypothetical protein
VTEPVFPTKWHLLAATMLIGVNDETGQILLQTDAEGQPVLPMWTDEDAARAALPGGYSLRTTLVRERIAELPEGIKIAVDQGQPQAMWLPADYVAALKPLAVPFPAGSTFKVWPDLPEETEAAIRAAASAYSFVDDVWALVYFVDAGPYQGCLVYSTEAGVEGQESVVDALTRALDATPDPAALGVQGVQIVSLRDTPPEVQATISDQPRVYSRAR